MPSAESCPAFPERTESNWELAMRRWLMILSLPIEEPLAWHARQVGESRGMSLEQLVRHYLEDLTADSSAEQDIAELRQFSEQGNSQGWRFDRDEIHARV